MADMSAGDRAKMQAARVLIEEQRYGEARSLLQNVHHPKAHEWMAKLDRIAPAPTAAPPPLPTQQYYAPQQYVSVPESFTTKLIITILLLFVFVLPGLIALVIFSREAKDAQERSNYPIPGAQELIALNRIIFILIFIGLAFLVLFMLLPLINYYL